MSNPKSFGLDSFSIADLEMKPPPSLPVRPMFDTKYHNLQPPKPKVQNVSLIFDSSNPMTTMGNTSRGTCDRKNSSSHAASRKEEYRLRDTVLMQGESISKLEKQLAGLKKQGDFSAAKLDSIVEQGDFKSELLRLLQEQRESQVKLEMQMKLVLEFQETFLSHFLKTGNVESKGVQTDPVEFHSHDSKNEETKYVLTSKIDEKVDRVRSGILNKTKINIADSEVERKTSPLQAVNFSNTNSNIQNEKSEDLSAILKDLQLQLPSMREPSICSAASFKPLDFEDFDDEDTPNSVHESSWSDISVKAREPEANGALRPTMTFYRNVLGNVNKLLDGNDKELRPFELQKLAQKYTAFEDVGQHEMTRGFRSPGIGNVGSSEASVYASNNLSFDTKQYLQRHGLVGRQSVMAPATQDDNILDVDLLKRQPKLL